MGIEKNISKSHLQYYKEVIDVFKKYVNKNSLNHGSTENLLENPQFRLFMDSFPGIVGIIDLNTQNYIYMSNNVKSILGYEPHEFYEDSFQKLVTIFPNGHNEVIIHKVFPIMFQYFEKHAIIGDVKDIRVSYNSFVIRKDGSIGCYLHQLNVFHTDESGKPTLLLKLITEISEIKKDRNITMAVSRKGESGIFHTIYSQNFLLDSEEELLSNRELEVLNLISQGRNSIEIGNTLCISLNTVYRHRKNMLKKNEGKKFRRTSIQSNSSWSDLIHFSLV